MSRIVVSGRLPASAIDLLRVAAPEPGGVWVWDHDDLVPGDLLAAQLADCEGLVAVWNQVDRALLDAAPNLKVVANTAVGYDNIDVAACTARGVRATNTPRVLSDATADLAFGLLLMVARRLGEADRLVRAGRPWPHGFSTFLATDLRGKRLGVVGMGLIGQEVARRARAFGMHVVYHNRRAVAPPIEADLGARLVPLGELLATSDVVSLNLPYTPESHHLIDAAALAAMKPTAFVVNTARGKVVDEAALVEALRSGTIAGAGLDVFENEPTVHPGLLELENVALAPHIGSATLETRTAMAELACRNVVAVLSGEPPLTPVN